MVVTRDTLIFSEWTIQIVKSQSNSLPVQTCHIPVTDSVLSRRKAVCDWQNSLPCEARNSVSPVVAQKFMRHGNNQANSPRPPEAGPPAVDTSGQQWPGLPCRMSPGVGRRLR